MQHDDANLKRAIAVVESLRAGIPTRLSTQELPDLRPELTELIGQDLTQFAAGKHPPGRLIWGSYGQGKTHALTTIEHMALEQGFAVSRVSLSREVSCHQLFTFYTRVASVVRTPDSKFFGLSRALSRKTLNHLADSPLSQPDRYVHPLPAIILEDTFFATGEEQDLLYGDLVGNRLSMAELRRIHREGRGTTWPRFESNFRPADHSSAYFGVMADAITLCGYKGWVILIDEVELMGRLGKTGRLQAYHHLHWLLNWSGSMSYPIYTLGMAASSLRNDVWFKGNKGNTAKNDQTVIPELAAQKLGSEAATEMKTFFDQAISPHCPTLKLLESEQLTTLLKRVVDLHGLAYQWDPQLDLKTVMKSIGSQPVRTYLRATLEALDISYIYRETVKLSTSKLTETSVSEDKRFFSIPEEA